MNTQRAIDKAQRRRSEASWRLKESLEVCPRSARRDRQAARHASSKAGRQMSRAEERGALRAAPDLDGLGCDIWCRCEPLPEWSDIQAMPPGVRYFGEIESDTWLGLAA